MKLVPFTMATETDETMTKKQQDDNKEGGEKKAASTTSELMTDKKEEASSEANGTSNNNATIDKKEEEKEKESNGKEEGKGETIDTGKKKRTASRQITQDDYGDDDDDDDNIDRNAPFSKASKEVLAKRRIVKVKRPIASTTGGGSSSNPFAGTNFLKTTGVTSASATAATSSTATATIPAAANGSNGTKSSSSNSPTKVFGSGTTFGGFGTAAASAKTGGGFGSSTGFGAASSSSGFGAVPASSSFDKSSSDQNNESKTVGFGKPNFFGNSNNTSGGFTFNLQDKKKDASTATEDNDNGGGGGDGTSSSKNAPVCQLPANYELTTGEEGEKHLHEVRCKTFLWDIITKTSTNADNKSNEHATPAVKPSSNFEKKITSATDDENDDVNKSSKQNNDKDDDGNNTGESAKEGWRELGIGPLKLLLNEKTGRYRLVQRRESKPNGNAHKVILNLPVWKETKCIKTNDKNYTLITPGPDGLEKYLLKFKEPVHALTFSNEINAHKILAKSVYSQSN